MNPQDTNAMTEDEQMKSIRGTGRRALQLIIGVPLFLVTAGFSGIVLAQDEVSTTQRVSVTRQSTASDKDSGNTGESVEDSYDALDINGQKSGTTRAS